MAAKKKNNKKKKKKKIQVRVFARYEKCNCFKFNCEGALVSLRTFQRHAKADHHGAAVTVDDPEEVYI
jgi:hypothetical protein